MLQSVQKQYISRFWKKMEIEKNGSWNTGVRQQMLKISSFGLGTGKNRQREKWLLLQSNMKLPSLHGRMPVFSGTISGVNLIRNQSPPVQTALERQVSNKQRHRIRVAL